MASLFSLIKTTSCLALALAMCVQVAFGGVTCEDLGESTCAFAVSSSGTRCVLEKHVTTRGGEKYTCRASEIVGEKLTDWIESDRCIEACGVERKTVGISSDLLLESRFVQKLCSQECYQNCPNIVDLYFNLAAGEGVFLPKLCQAQSENDRRQMAEIKSSGVVAAGPESGSLAKSLAYAPAGLPEKMVLAYPPAMPPF